MPDGNLPFPLPEQEDSRSGLDGRRPSDVGDTSETGAMYGPPPSALRESGHRQGTRQQRQRLIGEVRIWPIAAYNLGSMGNVLNQRKVTIVFEGRTITGVYTVWSGMITVSTANGKKVTQVGDSSSSSALDGLARILLRELAQEGKA